MNDVLKVLFEAEAAYAAASEDLSVTDAEVEALEAALASAKAAYYRG